MIDKRLRIMLGGFLTNYSILEDAEEGIDKAISQIKALYKPLGKEELEKIIYPELVLIITTQNKDKHFDCINNNKISANATNQIADAIINARGE